MSCSLMATSRLPEAVAPPSESSFPIFSAISSTKAYFSLFPQLDATSSTTCCC
jgi:hypothetical protein